jgi:putative colanic acid biosynthesis UDP-glucose lipid carrier transferase
MYRTLFKNNIFFERLEKNKRSKPISKQQAYSKEKVENFDFFVALSFLIFIGIWLFPLIALIIKCSSKGPVYFRQLRHGKDNQPFYCLKFRTMIKNNTADTLQAQKGDQRITKFGSFLRKSSLDELPQLINILRGEMSLIGPRPHALPMNEIFSDIIPDYMLRHTVKPGLTGLAQSKGFRGEIRNWQDLYGRYRLDMFYLKKKNWILDLKIIIWTAKSLFFDNRNAY